MDNLGIEIELIENFLLIKETLERMGIRNSQERKFFPSCYCIEEDGKYYIYHFKELFSKEGKESTFNDIDKLRRNTIAYFLQKWGLIKTKEDISEIMEKKIDVLSHADKPQYQICHKFIFRTKIKKDI